jgi:hypothetical protein
MTATTSTTKRGRRGPQKTTVPHEILCRIERDKLIEKYGVQALQRLKRYREIRAKQFARLVAAGCSVRSLARVFEVSAVDVSSWAKQGAKLLEAEAEAEAASTETGAR